MNFLNISNILGPDTSLITIIISYLLPFIIVVAVYFIDKKNTLTIFLFTLFLFLTLTYILYSSKGYQIDLSKPFNKDYYGVEGGDLSKLKSSLSSMSSSLGSISDSVKEQLNNPLCFPLNLAQLLIIFGYLALSMTLIFNTNKKNKSKYFIFNSIIQYSLFYNFLFILMTSHQIAK